MLQVNKTLTHLDLSGIVTSQTQSLCLSKSSAQYCTNFLESRLVVATEDTIHCNGSSQQELIVSAMVLSKNQLNLVNSCTGMID